MASVARYAMSVNMLLLLALLPSSCARGIRVIPIPSSAGVGYKIAIAPFVGQTTRIMDGTAAEFFGVTAHGDIIVTASLSRLVGRLIRFVVDNHLGDARWKSTVAVVIEDDADTLITRNNAEGSNKRFRRDLVATQSFSVSEDTLPGRYVFTIQASTLDNSNIFSMSDTSSANPFQVDMYSGNVSLKSNYSLNYYNGPTQYSVLVIISNAVLSTSNQVNINVTVTASTPPFFMMRPPAQPFLAAVNYFAPAGTSVLQLTAGDNDPDAFLTFGIISGNDAGIFSMSSDGLITTKGRHLLPDAAQYLLTVYVQNVNAPNNSNSTATAQVLITVGMIPPQFDAIAYFPLVYENSAPGSLIQSVVVKSFQRSPVDVSMGVVYPPLAQPLFQLAQSGSAGTTNIVTMRPLNLEYDPLQYQFVLTAIEIETALSSSIQVNVTVLPSNSYQPDFGAAVIVPANPFDADVPVGTYITTVMAYDPDLGENGRLTYSLSWLSGVPVPFSITTVAVNGAPGFRYAGNITVSGRLNYAMTRIAGSYNLLVTATDHGNLSRSGMVNVTVILNQVDMFTPQFPAGRIVYVEQAKTLGSFVAEAQAFDEDGDALTYQFAGGSTSSPFAISSSTGLITLAGQLVAKMNYILNISSTSFGSCCPQRSRPPRIGYGTINILVVSTNTPPAIMGCSNYSTTTRVKEKTANLPVLVVVATDPDAGPNGNVTYYLVPQTNDFFVIDPRTGSITTKSQAIDRDTGPTNQMYLTVEARDDGIVPLSAFCTIVIGIDDINDNKPVMNLPQGINVNASIGNSTGLYKLVASDRDTGVNAQVDFFISINVDNRFYVGPQNMLMSYYTLNVSDAFIIEVTARDRGSPSQSSPQKMDIRVVAKQKAPTFVYPNLSQLYSLPENSASDYLITPVQAVTAAGNVTYSLMWVESIFYGLSSSQTCIATNSFCLAVYAAGLLDAGKTVAYTARIRATPQTGDTSYDVNEAFVQIRILDVNDKIPTFVNRDSNGFIYVAFPENKQLNPGIVLSTLVALDADPTPAFQTANYMLESINDVSNFAVALSGSSALLTVAFTQTFDREVKDTYSLTADAIDGSPSSRPGASNGAPNLGNVGIRINVIDVNDNAPSFANLVYSPAYSLLESAVIGTNVLTALATDSDIANEWQYALSTGNTNDAFAVDNQGAITVHNYLDYEARARAQLPPFYYMQLIVSDGVFTATTYVNISLTPANMHAPVFSQAVYNVGGVVEKTAYSSSFTLNLTVVTANDADLHRSTSITYGLLGSNANKFGINPGSGQVWLQAPLARDGPGGRPQWSVTVTAADERNPYTKIGFAVVVVTLVDINDHAPVFSPGTLIGSVSENASSGQRFMTVSAIDLDYGPNGNVTYLIIDSSIVGYATGATTPLSFPSQAAPLFTMSLRGQVSANTGSLNRDIVDRYTFVVVASDQGLPPLSSNATVTVMVSDGNNHPPKFLKSCWAASITEAIAFGATIVQLQATDLDPSDNLKYSINSAVTKSSLVNQYRIGQDTGTLSLSAPLNYDYTAPQKPPVYTVWVTVSDGLHTDLACVNLTVISSTTIPVFTNASISVSIQENVTIGTTVAQFQASERNPGAAQFMKIEYLVDRSTDPGRYFAVDVVSGTVTTARMLDRESQAFYRLAILAIASGLPPGPATATAALLLTVSDVSDEAPVLSTTTVYITEFASAGTFAVPQLLVYDPDSVPSPPCSMSAYGASATSMDFAFSSLQTIPDSACGAGQLGSLRTLQRVDGAQRTFQLLVSDSGGRSAVVNVTVIIADIDNNPPTAATRTALVYNYMGWTLAASYRLTSIGTCYAADKDDWDLPYKVFGKVGSWPPAFDINGITGMITANLSAISAGSTTTLQCSVSDNYITDVSCQDTCRTNVTVTSTVIVNILVIPSSPVMTGGSVRFKGVTAEQFVQPGSSGQPSLYNLFKQQLSQILGTDVANVDVFTVRNVAKPDAAYIDVRYTAHGSPYYDQSKLTAAVLQNQDALSQLLGLTVAQSPVNECTQEGCPGGCINELVIGSLPLLVNANGSSLVAVDSYYRAACGGCAQSDSWQPQSCDDVATACLNGGTCTLNEDSLAVSCTCPPGYDGPRCQQTAHTFSGNGWAWYPMLSQCNVTLTSLEILTTDANAVLFYNGPFRDPGSAPDAVPDFIALTLESGQPTLYVDQGTGSASVAVHTNVADGRWHKLEISRSLREISLVVDGCIAATPFQSDPTIMDQSTCKGSMVTPKENMYINVYNPLEMGGRSDGAVAYWPPAMATSSGRNGLDGCIKNFIHRGQLYDLHIGMTGKQQNSADGCAQAKSGCARPDGTSLCGANSTCVLDAGGNWACSCLPQWLGENCDISTPFLEYDLLGYVNWNLTNAFSNYLNQNMYYSLLQLTFRSRDPDGNGRLLMLTGASGQYLRLEVIGGLLQLRYTLGNQVVSPSYYIVRLGTVVVTDGQLHTAVVVRTGKRVQLWLDGGAYYADGGEPYYSNQLLISDGSAFSGAEFSGGSFNLRSVLVDSCITDVRINDRWFPMSMVENTQSPSAIVVDRENVADNCTDSACQNGTCPAQQICIDLWRKAVCSCASGWQAILQQCSDVDECQSNPCQHGGTCVNTPGSFNCQCSTNWLGSTCNIQGPQAIVALSNDTITVIVVIPCVVLLLIFVAILFITRRGGTKKGESDYDPYDDIRENVIHYDEEGVPEEDQDAYDISRLGKPPIGGDLTNGLPFGGPLCSEGGRPLGSGFTPPPLDGPRATHPDVGDFIESRLVDADDDPHVPPTDGLCDYGYEGNGSSVGSLSSLGSAQSDESQDYDYLNEWGPKFQRLSDMYNDDSNS